MRFAARSALLLPALWLLIACATTNHSLLPATLKSPAYSGSVESTTAPGAAQTADGARPAVGSAGAQLVSGHGEAPDGASVPSGKGEAGKTAASPPEAVDQPTPAEVSREILARGSAGFWPLSSGGQALVVERRTSPGASPEVFALFVSVASKSDGEVSKLSDFSNLFDPTLAPLAFTLVQFSERGGRLHEVRTFPLGDHLVFESLKIIPIMKGADLPFAVSATFLTQEGSIDRWVTFSQEGTSELVLRQTLSRSFIIEDIDNDGYLDIIVRERGAEEGTGYETFLTWYKWDGRSFKEYRTTNIVRNLRDFLDRSATLLSEDEPAQFFRTSIPAAVLAKLRADGLSELAIFERVFHLAVGSPDNPNDPLPNLASITQVIFPNIFENPFTEQDRYGYSFPMTVRFVSSDGTSHFYSAKVYMHRNPFVEPQFTFAVELPRSGKAKP